MDPVVDVAIIGYGPTGATLANLLGAHGVSVAVIEREPDLLDLPRAVHFDDEVMRLLDTMGLARGFAHECRPSGGMRYLNPAGQLMLERAPAREPGPQGWHTNYLFHQPDFERLLRRGVARYPSVRVHAATELESVQQDDDGATLVLDELATSRRRPLRARWVVGCDGARSLPGFTPVAKWKAALARRMRADQSRHLKSAKAALADFAKQAMKKGGASKRSAARA